MNYIPRETLICMIGVFVKNTAQLVCSSILKSFMLPILNCKAYGHGGWFCFINLCIEFRYARYDLIARIIKLRPAI